MCGERTMIKRTEEGFNRALGLRLMVLRQSKKNITRTSRGLYWRERPTSSKVWKTVSIAFRREKLALCADILNVPIGYFYGEGEETLQFYDRSVLSAAADINQLPENIKRVIHHLARVIGKELH